MKIYTLEEAADVLKLSSKTLRQYCVKGQLEAVKIGRFWRISEAALQSFLKGNQEPTMWHRENAGQPALTDADIEPVDLEELLAESDPGEGGRK